MPDMFERYMKLGQASFENKNYIEARDFFESAYDLKDDVEANHSVVKSLVALKEYESAYSVIKEKKRSYLIEEELFSIYFEVLLQLNYFLEIDKLLVSNEFGQLADYQKAYSIAKEYHLLLYKEKFKQIESKLTQLGEVKAIEQSEIIKELNYLPRERAVPIIQELLVNPSVSIFSRSELVQQLAQIKEEKVISVLTYDNQLREFKGSQIATLKECYQTNQVLKEVSQYVEQHQPSLTREIQQAIKLHIGCVYPFDQEVMLPIEDWCSSYLEKYGVKEQWNMNESVQKIQERLDQEVFKLMFFH